MKTNVLELLIIKTVDYGFKFVFNHIVFKF
jgi:hypothetical protein